MNEQLDFPGELESQADKLKREARTKELEAAALDANLERDHDLGQSLDPEQIVRRDELQDAAEARISDATEKSSEADLFRDAA